MKNYAHKLNNLYVSHLIFYLILEILTTQKFPAITSFISELIIIFIL